MQKKCLRESVLNSPKGNNFSGAMSFHVLAKFIIVYAEMLRPPYPLVTVVHQENQQLCISMRCLWSQNLADPGPSGRLPHHSLKWECWSIPVCLWTII